MFSSRGTNRVALSMLLSSLVVFVASALAHAHEPPTMYTDIVITEMSYGDEDSWYRIDTTGDGIGDTLVWDDNNQFLTTMTNEFWYVNVTTDIWVDFTGTIVDAAQYYRPR